MKWLRALLGMKPARDWRLVEGTGSYQEIGRVRVASPPDTGPKWAVHYHYGYIFVDFHTGDQVWMKTYTHRWLPTRHPPYTTFSDSP